MARTDKRLTDDPIVLRIMALLRKRKKTERELTEFLGISSGGMSKWKYYGSGEYLKYVEPICEFLDTTPNYLFFGPADEEERMTPVEKELIRMYRKMSQDKKRCIRDTMVFFTEKSK